MVVIKRGSVLDTKMMYIVNPLSTTCVMNDGVSKVLKKRHLGMFNRTKQDVKFKLTGNGKFRTYDVGHNHKGEYGFVLNIFVKVDNKDESKLSFIKHALKNYMRFYKDRAVTSIAFSLIDFTGNLDRNKVFNLMYNTLKDSIITTEIWIPEDMKIRKK